MSAQPKSPQRLAVERALQEATEDNPLTTEQIAKLAGVNLMQARTALGNCVATRLGYNLNGEKGGPGLYVRGQPKIAEPVNSPRSVPKELLVQKKFEPSRPGCMDAFDKPHLVNGERYDRVRPAIIGSQPAQAVAVHGGRVPT